MFPQYAQRQTGGEIAIWLLITVGALLIPIIIIAICCIRRHWLRRPRIKLMENRPPRMMLMTKQLEALRTYNGPCIEPGHDEVDISLENNTAPTFSRTNSLKKQHVHWPDGSTIPKINDSPSIKPKASFSGGNILNTTILTESPLAHRRPTNSNLSHFIQTAIMPAGSTISSTGTSQFFTPSKEFTSISAGSNSIM